MLEFPVREEFDDLSFFTQTGCGQEIGFNHRILLETIEVSEMDDGHLFPERVPESPFRKPSLKGHLASLKTCLRPSAGTGILALMSLAGGLSVTGPNSPSHSLSLLS
jgi:hypothetical protein